MAAAAPRTCPGPAAPGARTRKAGGEAGPPRKRRRRHRGPADSNRAREPPPPPHTRWSRGGFPRSLPPPPSPSPRGFRTRHRPAPPQPRPPGPDRALTWRPLLGAAGPRSPAPLAPSVPPAPGGGSAQRLLPSARRRLLPLPSPPPPRCGGTRSLQLPLPAERGGGAGPGAQRGRAGVWRGALRDGGSSARAGGSSGAAGGSERPGRAAGSAGTLRDCFTGKGTGSAPRGQRSRGWRDSCLHLPVSCPQKRGCSVRSS